MALSDEVLARMLQAEFDEEDGQAAPSSSNPSRVPSVPSSSKPMSLIDTQWELLDPTPDPRALFLEFNSQFFWGKLAGVEVRWSPRMTLCAGVCSYEGFGGLCSIRLSVPLLKLRPRKDLVETLLHEMIHAYLFVTRNNRDRDGHGPEFCKHMYRINKEAGTKITIYHSFHDEVDNYRQHWWRCDGPCRSRKPYFGYVKRAMNRAPSAQDPWWAGHQQSCGGTYTKVKEPEGYGQKKRKKDRGDSEKENDSEAAEKKQRKEGQDIRNFIPFTGQGHRIGGPSTSGKGPNGPGALLNRDNQAGTGQPLINSVHKGSSSQINVTDRGGTGSSNSKTKLIDKNGALKKGFNLAKREKKLEELRSIFVSDSEDEEEADKVRVKVSERPVDLSPARDKRPTWREQHSGNGRQLADASGSRTDNSHTSSWRKMVSSGSANPGRMDGSSGKSDSRSRVDKHRNRDVASSARIPNSSNIGTTSGRTNIIDLDGPGSIPHKGGTQRTEHPSGQASLDNFLNRSQGSGVPSNRPPGREDISGRVQTVQEGVKRVKCPVCSEDIVEREINSHLDSCLSGFG